MNRKYKHIVFILLGAILLASCNRVNIIVDEIPPNTPIGEPIYITGNFNRWSPGEERFQMKLRSDSTYAFIVPSGYGELKYKFTRGGWASVEKDLCGNEIEDRSLFVNENTNVVNIIESWADLDPVNCDQRTISIEMLPGNTPENAIIAIASELNSWNPNSSSIMEEVNSGNYIINIQRPLGKNNIQFKVTRGDLNSVETDVFGNEIPNRILEFGKKDTLKISIEGWVDLPMKQPESVILVLKNIPQVTPEDEPLFLASKLNGWKSGDREYLFKKNSKGQYYIKLPRKKLLLDYKITRDGWHTVEVNQFGEDIDNRQISLAKADTSYIEVLRWKDQDFMDDETITLVLNQLPSSTPVDAQIYLSGNFNNWEPGRLSFRFRQGKDGRYYANIRRGRGDLEFKITRGNWNQEAINQDGSAIVLYRYNYPDSDTLLIEPTIKYWKDLPPKPKARNVTIVIDKLPDRTPQNPEIFFTSNINSWDPESLSYEMTQLDNGKFFITIPRSDNYIEYKITRGGWQKVETDPYQNDIENRIQYFGFADTVYIEVERWKDL